MPTIRTAKGSTMPGILFSQMEPPHGLLEEFHRWYDDEHIPHRLRVPGFERAVRYRVREGSPDWLAVYELSDLAALEDPTYLQLKQKPSPLTTRMLAAVQGFTRYTCEEVSVVGQETSPHRYLSVVAFTVPAEDEDSFDDWYATEHAPLLLAAPGWLRVRRYRVRSGDGGPWTHLALHELADLDVLSSRERAAAREAPKRMALAQRPWFARSGRWVYERWAG